MFKKFLVVLLSIALLFVGIEMGCSKPEAPTPPSKTCFVNGIDTCNPTVVIKPLDAKISVTEEFQTIQNFGASDCLGHQIYW
ncbi:MAG: hypothetical protein HC817_04160 [Saprospiraceae bacterium]|nr:hypothetical protein [Saprospiraceae bacterium]